MNNSLFDKYVYTFDFNNKMIERKYNHTYRVVEYANNICEHLKLDEKTKLIAYYAALFHDIARFNQATIFNTFVDSISFDHGTEGQVLFDEKFKDKIDLDEVDLNTISKSIYYHNKLKVENLNEEELLIAKIVRDADKLDIIDTQNNQITDNYFIIDDQIILAIKNHTLLDNSISTHDIDNIFRGICFIFDLNFDYSKNIMLKIIDRKFRLLESYNINIKDLEKEIINYVKEN